MKKEDLDLDPQSMNNRKLSAIARNPNHPMHTHAASELARRKVKRRETEEGAMKRIATTQSNKTDRMASSDKKGLETFKKREMKNEEKDPEEYDNEGSMMKSQLRQICSANEKLMSMVKDDDNLPEWVQSKVTKATDYIRSVRDYLDSEKMDDDDDMKESVEWVCGKCSCDPCTCGEQIEEKTLTPAEKRKREKIAKAIERDNPDMPMDKKMAIATATAKRVAEAYKVGQTVKPTKGPHAGQDHEVIHVHGDGSYNIKPKNMPASRIRYRLGAARAKHDELKEISKDKLYNYMHKSAGDVAKARGDARRQDKRIGGQKKADDKIRAMQGKRDAAHIKVPATESTDLSRIKNILKK